MIITINWDISTMEPIIIEYYHSNKLRYIWGWWKSEIENLKLYNTEQTTRIHWVVDRAHFDVNRSLFFLFVFQKLLSALFFLFRKCPWRQRGVEWWGCHRWDVGRRDLWRKNGAMNGKPEAGVGAYRNGCSPSNDVLEFPP